MEKYLNNSGYTMLELMVVLAIIAFLFTISLNTILSFQQTARLNEVNSEIFAKIKDFQNNAKVNRYGLRAQTELRVDETLQYNIDILENSISATICENTTPRKCISYLEGYDLTIDNENFKIDLLNDKNCKKVTFKSSDTNISLTSVSNQQINTCCIYIKNVKSNESRVIKIDSLSRSITSVEYDESDFCYN